jgi:hypothetical protein
MKASRTVGWIVLAVVIAGAGLMVWAFCWYYRPTLEYAYTSVETMRVLTLAIVLLGIVLVIVWRVVKK